MQASRSLNLLQFLGLLRITSKGLQLLYFTDFVVVCPEDKVIGIG